MSRLVYVESLQLARPIALQRIPEAVMVVSRYTSFVLSQFVLLVHRVSDLVPLLPDKVFYSDDNTGSRHASEGDSVTQKVPRAIGRTVDLSGNTELEQKG